MKNIKELYPGKNDQHIINKLRKKYDNMEYAFINETGHMKQKCIYCEKDRQFISIFKGYKEICSDNECKRKYFVQKNNERIQKDKSENKVLVKCNVCEKSDLIVQNTIKNKNKSNICKNEFCIKNKDRSFLLEKHIIDNFDYKNLSYLNILCYNLMIKYKNRKKVLRILYKNLLLNGIGDFSNYINHRSIKDILVNNFSSEIFEMTKDSLYYINMEKKDKENVLKSIYGDNLEEYIIKYYPDKFKNCSICGKKYKISNIFKSSRKSKETCSIQCYRKNFKFYITEERKEKQRISMIEKIKSGEFTPNIFNSMTRKNMELKFPDGIIKFRSSWEILFWVMNPGYSYESLRIDYIHEGKSRLYLVDFINYDEKKVVEVKPHSKEKDPKNLLKMEKLKEWGNKNGFETITITERELKNYKYLDFLKTMEKMEYEISEDLSLKIRKILEKK